MTHKGSGTDMPRFYNAFAAGQYSLYLPVRLVRSVRNGVSSDYRKTVLTEMIIWAKG